MQNEAERRVWILRNLISFAVHAWNFREVITLEGQQSIVTEAFWVDTKNFVKTTNTESRYTLGHFQYCVVKNCRAARIPDTMASTFRFIVFATHKSYLASKIS